MHILNSQPSCGSCHVFFYSLAIMMQFHCSSPVRSIVLTFGPLWSPIVVSWFWQQCSVFSLGQHIAEFNFRTCISGCFSFQGDVHVYKILQAVYCMLSWHSCLHSLAIQLIDGPYKHQVLMPLVYLVAYQVRRSLSFGEYQKQLSLQLQSVNLASSLVQERLVIV